ncbi:L-alanine-DL-glutamate epimerase-like enolase superfamily enzyme [Friedmanniella endophytica]|uniref:L-alanine-DL-glutamate epimerase-like enolase superfamily enzyme n=1 Tax=Microlunatus kandeliicorticis TaxID=1759536 RepID=A0A7W3P5H6_9ACTN|nr:mandelate racemase/muconate lactonizing enzyme family protein [Microlunatus kandeliicorticis]MBA8793872.1 L-alanine-DL-glutamate epimerase-like enolase superfamily enzyme [Microlunatus kandeliicorticis]
MKITGYRTVSAPRDRGRLIGDVNGVTRWSRTEVVIIETDTGIEGIGVGSVGAIEAVFPTVEGEDPRSTSALYDRMLAAVFKLGHAGATFATIGAVDQALWDLKAKAADEPLWRMLGARDRFVPGYASGLEYGLDDEEAGALWTRFAERGFRAGKTKGGREFSRDLRRLRLLEEILHANTETPALMIDANESWHVSQAIRYVSRLEAELDLTWIEEPVRRWDADGLATVRRGVRAGVASGENLTGLEQTRALVAAQAVDVVQPNAAFGSTNFLRVAHLAHAYDLPVSPVGFAPAIAAAAASIPNLLTVEVQELEPPAWLHFDLQIADGGLVLGDESGAGITVDEAALRDMADTVVLGIPSTTGPHVRPRRAGLRMTPDED